MSDQKKEIPRKITTRSQSSDTRDNQNEITLQELSKIDKNSRSYRELTQLVKDNLENFEFVHPSTINTKHKSRASIFEQTKNVTINIPKLSEEDILNPFQTRKSLVNSPLPVDDSETLTQTEISVHSSTSINSEEHSTSETIITAAESLDTNSLIQSQHSNNTRYSSDSGEEHFQENLNMTEAKLTFRDAVTYMYISSRVQWR